jgi:hypothetical protein
VERLEKIESFQTKIVIKGNEKTMHVQRNMEKSS